jgi:hemoglobin/transferrin/lactoferrin receptor protein
MKYSFLHTGVATVALMLLSTPAFAAGNDDDAAASGTITVTATRTPTPVIEAPATVSVITDLDIDDTLSNDVKDLIRFEPGVSVRSAPSRFSAALSSTGRDGNAGFNIRGLEGNRVLIQTDGIRLPDAFGFGAQAVGRGDYADLDILKSVEILRGPASALYGSDGLAGAVSFETKDPSDFLSGNANFGGRARLGYSSADESWAKGAVIAGRSGTLSMLAAYTRRDGHEQDNQGTNDATNSSRTTPNPQDIASNAVLAKLVWQAAEAHRFRLTYEHFDRDVDTPRVFSAVFNPASGPIGATSTVALAALDKTRRNRASLDYRYKGNGTIKRAGLVGYYQQSRTREFSAEDRNISADRTRDSTFDNRVIGASGQIEAGFGSAAFSNSVIFGGDVSVTRQAGIRDGTIPPAGETFPTRAFPITDYTLAGAFVQDEIGFADGRIKLYPAIRLDYYKLTPQPDALFPSQTAGQSDTHVSPKFGAIGWVTDSIGLFANYASGFKAPSPSQVNNGFTNIIQNYSSIPNPDLKPETSETIEGGLRFRNVGVAGAKLTASVTGFTGRYKDFIDQRQLSGNFTPASPGIFQYVNVGRVQISGVEGKVDVRAVSGWFASLAASYTHGDGTTGGVTTPLSSIDPVKVVGGFGYRDPGGKFGGQLLVTHSAHKEQSRINEACGAECVSPAAFTIVDATAFVTVAKVATLRVGIFNLFDTKYAWWSDVRGLAASSNVLDAYTQPGRNLGASLTFQF